MVGCHFHRRTRNFPINITDNDGRQMDLGFSKPVDAYLLYIRKQEKRGVSAPIK